MNPRPPLSAVALLSAAALGYEVLLMRLFSIIQWHHFAYLSISVALLGFGAAGTFVTLGRSRLLSAWPRSFSLPSIGFAFSTVACFAAAGRVPFNALEIFWDPGQFIGLSAIYLLLFIPFFLAATALCVAYARFDRDIPRLYGADILGAGVGSLALLGVLVMIYPADALRFICGLGLAAAAWSSEKRRALRVILSAAALAIPWLLPDAAVRLVPSEYKDLSQALRVKDARVIAERTSPLGVVTAVESPFAPIRHAPGLSLNAAAGPPAQLGLFVDGQSAGAVTSFDGDAQSLAFLGEMPSALPYHLLRLLREPRVLVLGAGGGMDVLQALHHKASMIDAVELDGQTAAVVSDDLSSFSGRPFSHPGVRLYVAEARGYLAGSRERYDLIQMAMLDAFGTSAAGLGSLAENHLYTVEALEDAIGHLSPGGLLAVTRWVLLPPRDSLRLLATAISALENLGVTDPGRSLVLIRSWSTATLLVRNGTFTEADIDLIRSFCRARSFDIAYMPGITRAETNVFNLLERDDFFEGAAALLGADRRSYMDRFKFNLEPSTDDRPYFFHFFKWRTLPEMMSLRSRGGLPSFDWGYPVLIMALVQAVFFSLMMILLPLALSGTRRAFAASPPGTRRRVPLYFLALGLGFMGVEIPMLHRFSLFLSHPTYAAAVILSAFLVFAGFGARFAARLRPSSLRPFASIAGLAAAYVFLLPWLLPALMGISLLWKMPITVGLIGPLAFCMGMPFPLGLAAVARQSPPLLPWAWSINGFASVVGTIVATLLAIHLGFAAVVLAAAVLYGIAAWQFPKQRQEETGD